MYNWEHTTTFDQPVAFGAEQNAPVVLSAEQPPASSDPDAFAMLNPAAANTDASGMLGQAAASDQGTEARSMLAAAQEPQFGARTVQWGPNAPYRTYDDLGNEVSASY